VHGAGSWCSISRGMELTARRGRRAPVWWAILLRPRALLAIATGIAVSLGGLAALAWRQHAADSRQRDARLELLPSALRFKTDYHAHDEDAHVHEASSQQRAMLAAGGSSGEDCASGFRHGGGNAVQDSDIICRWMPAPDEAVAAPGTAPSRVAAGNAAGLQQQNAPRRQCCCVSRRRASDPGSPIDDDEDDELMRSADALAAAFQYFAADAWRLRRGAELAAAAAATRRVADDSLAPGAASLVGHVGQTGDSLSGRPSAPSLLLQLLQRGAISFTCLPTVVIAGAQKAGTTALLGYLLLHPQFLAPPLYKELHHLDKDDRFYGSSAPARAAPSGRALGDSGTRGGGKSGEKQASLQASLLRTAATRHGSAEGSHADDALPQGHSQQKATGDAIGGAPASGLARYLHLLPDYYREYSASLQRAEQQRHLLLATQQRRKQPGEPPQMAPRQVAASGHQASRSEADIFSANSILSGIPAAALPESFSTFVGAHITGDASPSYALGTDTARRIAVALPEARVVMLLRDPAERAYSE